MPWDRRRTQQGMRALMHACPGGPSKAPGLLRHPCSNVRTKTGGHPIGVAAMRTNPCLDSGSFHTSS